MAKKRRLNKRLKWPLFILFIVFVFVLLLGLFSLEKGIKSVNSDAKTYKSKSCTAFYPSSDNGKQVAKDLCANSKEEKAVFDYALIPYGDYYLVEYGNGIHYYVDKQYKPLQINSISDDGKKILSEYLRYEMKKAEKDEAYTTSFLKETEVDNLDITDVSYNVNGQDLEAYFPKYDCLVHIPLRYIQKEAGINLGFKDEEYIKPSYISKRRKIVAFTFDDGPYVKTTPRIIDTLYKYNGNATFFVVGYDLTYNNVKIIKDSIAKGNQYGSHTQSHPYLVLLNEDEIYNEINGPANDLYYGYNKGTKYDFEGLKYQMSIYRPSFGEHNDKVDKASPFMSITWDCDSRDWDLKDKDAIKAEVYRFESKNPDELDGCIVLFHDIYDSTADAIEELVPELIDKGYQFVTIDELFKVLNIEKDNSSSYPW